MTYTTIERTQNGSVAVITMARPDALNALSPLLVAELLDAAQRVAQSEARVMLLTAQGRAFSAGADIKALQDPGFGQEQGKAFQANADRLMHLLETMPQVTIAVIRGYCFTGGLELALACDLLLAGDSALFADTHAKLGFRPRWGLTQRLPRRIGIQRAREMSFTGRRVGADEAVRIGLAFDMVADDLLAARADELAAAICANDGGSTTAYKRLYHASQNLPLDEGVAFEARAPR